MKPQSTYFLYGYYGAGNFGDDILLCAAVENILARDPAAKFLIRNHGPVDFLPSLGDRITLTHIEEIHHSSIPAPVKLLRLLRAYWLWMGRSSHLIVGGGTLIHDTPYLKSTTLLLGLALMARARGRRVYGIGLGTKKITTRPGRIVVGCLIRCFHRLCLRDQDSFDRCRALVPGARQLALTSDLAYALDWPPTMRGDAIGVTLVDYMFDHGAHAGLPEILAQALSVFIARGHDIRFMVLQKRSYAGGGDEAVLQQVLEKIPEAQRTKCRMVFPEPTPESVRAAYDGLGLMLGMRFHSLVFSALNRIPFAGLAHEPKIDALAREFSMPFLPLRQMETASMIRMIEDGLTSAIEETQIAYDQAMAKDNFIF